MQLLRLKPKSNVNDNEHFPIFILLLQYQHKLIFFLMEDNSILMKINLRICFFFLPFDEFFFKFFFSF